VHRVIQLRGETEYGEHSLLNDLVTSAATPAPCKALPSNVRDKPWEVRRDKGRSDKGRSENDQFDLVMG
jgi:hypothetical protein